MLSLSYNRLHTGRRDTAQHTGQPYHTTTVSVVFCFTRKVRQKCALLCHGEECLPCVKFIHMPNYILLYLGFADVRQFVCRALNPHVLCVKPGSQYDACASVASGWCWNKLDFYSSVASWALASIQPIRLSKNLTSGMQFDWWKKTLFCDAHDAHGARTRLKAWLTIHRNVSHRVK